MTTHFGFLNTGLPPVGNGQPVSYTLTYRNHGTGTAQGVTADVTALYALSLAGGQHQTVGLGDVGPGQEASVTLYGAVNIGLSPEPWAGLAVKIYDAAHPSSGQPVEWLWAHHAVDRAGPEFFGVRQPGYLLAAGVNDLRGYAYDAAGVPLISLEVQAPGGGATTINCPDASPTDGAWACAWNVTGAHGDIFNLRLHATDGFGQSAAWATGLPFRLDAQPPTLALDFAATQVAPDSLVRGGSFTVAGDVADDGGVASVTACFNGACRPADLQAVISPTAVITDDVPADPIVIDAGTTCAAPIVRTFVVTESFPIGDVTLGFAAEHARRDDLQVDLTSPTGTTVRVLDDDGRSGTEFRNYDVTLNDAAPQGPESATGDDDVTVADYGRFARPADPLRAFQGQNSVGVWTLTICDRNPATNDGAYLRSRLTLTPRLSVAPAGRWLYKIPSVGAADYVSQTVTVYAQDVVGNRTTDPLRLSFWADNVPPVITVTASIPEVSLGNSTTVLSGTVTDGGPAIHVSVEVHGPDGSASFSGAARDGDRWWYELPADVVGRHTLWVVAEDQAGNSSSAGPFAVDVGCTAADLVVTSVSAEPAASLPFSVTITALISNTGRAEASAGLPVGFYIGEERLGAAVTAQALGPGAAQAVSLTWAVDFPGDYTITVIPNDAGASVIGSQVLCSQPASGRQMVSVLDVPLLESWNLMSAYVNPFNPSASVVQRPIAGQYVVIQGFDGGAQSYYPDLPPEVNTLKEMDGEHGYWVKVKASLGGTQGNSGELGETEAVATLQVVGEKVAEDRPIELDAGWNLVSYLPRRPLAVPEALQSIDGQYTAVLGYDHGALSYYPDIDPSFNTLHEMTPLFGYWIRMAQTGTLQYPMTSQGNFGELRGTQGNSGELRETQGNSGGAESPPSSPKFLQVPPSSTLVNFYGTAQLPDGTPLPVGTTVLAVDPDGVVCGATMVTHEGQYGLLACYGDDPTTPEDECARPGDIIQLIVDDQILSMSTWTAHGERQWRPLGKADQWQLYLPLIERGNR